MFHFKNTSKLFKKKLILGAVLLLATTILLATFLPLAFKAKAVSYPVLVVNVGIAKGQKITADMLTVTKTTDASLAGKVAVNANDVVNQYAAVDLVADSHLLPSTVSKNELYPDIYSHLDNGMVALSVTFESFAGSLSGKLRKDDIVTTYYNIFGWKSGSQPGFFPFRA